MDPLSKARPPPPQARPPLPSTSNAVIRRKHQSRSDLGSGRNFGRAKSMFPLFLSVQTRPLLHVNSSMPAFPTSNAQAGPSRPRPSTVAHAKPKTKSIAKTSDLLARNDRAKMHSAGRVGAVLGNVANAFSPSVMTSGRSRQSSNMSSVGGVHTPELDRGKGKGKAKATNLPGAIQVERFAEARAMEIMALQQAIKSAAAFGNARVFQSLPRHLRRRAASHNPRRVPKRLRSKAAAEIDPNSTIAKMHRKRAKLRAKGDRWGRSRTEQLALRQRTSCITGLVLRRSGDVRKAEAAELKYR